MNTLSPLRRRAFLAAWPALLAGQTAPRASFSENTRCWTITWMGGSADLNLVPMNPAAQTGNKVGYAQMRSDESLYLPIADLVGIVGLRLAGHPPVPRILWDNREHQFWEGFEGSFEPRNVVVNTPTVEMLGDRAVGASYYFIANHVKTTIAWEFPRAARFFGWTTTITIENLSKTTLRNYFQFFACYHPPGTNYYWDQDNTIRPCSNGGFNATRDSEMAGLLRGSPYHSHMERYRREREVLYVRYRRPVLLSGIRPYYGGMRHILMVEPTTCASVATWYEQARDYTLMPPGFDLRPGDGFTGRVRHLIAPAETAQDLETYWGESP